MTTGPANISDTATTRGSRAALQARESLASLTARYPWPTERPSESPILWSLDYGGRRLVTDAIASRGVNVLLEIGSFLGGSARQWLAASRDVVVICVDPWPDLTDPGLGIAAHRIGRAYRDQLRAPDGVYRSFISSMWDVRHRIVHVRGMALDVLPELHALGLRPDMVYIDADKKGHEIPVCDELFPDAVITGDDWNWSDGYSFPIREPAFRSARKRGRRLKSVRTTWLIDDGPWTIRERLLQWQSSPRSLTQATHSLIKRPYGTTSSGRRR
jgi:hypothetical protein